MLAAGVALAVVVTAPPARADYLWLQTSDGQAQVRAGELGQPAARLPPLVEPKASLAGDKHPEVRTAADRYSFASSGGDIRFSALRVGSDGVLTYFQARHGRQDTKAVNDLELVPTEPNGGTFRLFFKGRPASASRVNVETAAGWRKALSANADGSITLDTPIPGLYVLEISAKVDNAKVTVHGQSYADVRYTATLSFDVTPR